MWHLPHTHGISTDLVKSYKNRERPTVGCPFGRGEPRHRHSSNNIPSSLIAELRMSGFHHNILFPPRVTVVLSWLCWACVSQLLLVFELWARSRCCSLKSVEYAWAGFLVIEAGHQMVIWARPPCVWRAQDPFSSLPACIGLLLSFSWMSSGPLPVLDLTHWGSCLVTYENGQSCGQLLTSHPMTTWMVSGDTLRIGEVTQCGFGEIYVPSPCTETLHLKQEIKLQMSLTILPCPTCSPSH